MQCLVLAAGYATRLYPLTENYPKPLLKVGEKTILDHLLDDLDQTGEIERYVVISNRKFAPIFTEWAKTRSGSVAVLDDGTTSNEGRLGAVRDVAFAIGSLSLDDDLLVIAGDNLLDFSLARFLAYAKGKGASSVLRYFEPSIDRLKKCGVLEIGSDDRILSMVEKPAEPKSHWCCPPFYFFTKADARRVEEGIASGCGVDAPGSFIAWLASVSPVYAMEMPGRRYDIGDIKSYEEVRKNYRGIEQ
ncbi:MAG: nucleotidyltransferase family protein [Clostridia bacterium]|nr:nucleotidyltransferase family protein [Clostridia bacterium]